MDVVPEPAPNELSLVIPVYNEGANFPALWSAVDSQIKSRFRAFVVYDFDEDNTVPVLRQIISTGETRLIPVKNNVGRGVIGAIRTGFNQVDGGPVLVIMADLSDDLAQVDQMVEYYRRGYQVVVASRYMPGGRLLDAPPMKGLMSRVAGLSLHWFRGIPTRDATNAFKLYDSKILKTMTIESKAGFRVEP